MRISDWSSDVCSSDLRARPRRDRRAAVDRRARLSHPRPARRAGGARVRRALPRPAGDDTRRHIDPRTPDLPRLAARADQGDPGEGMTTPAAVPPFGVAMNLLNYSGRAMQIGRAHV